MLSFYIIFTLVMCSLHAYLFFKLRHLLSSPFAKFALLITLILLLALLLLRHSKIYDLLPDFTPWVSYTWLGFVLIAFGCFMTVDVLRLLFFGIKLLCGKNPGFFLAPAVSAPFALFAAVAISGYAMYEATNIQVNHFTIKSAKSAGELKKLRIVAVSDLHIGETISLGKLQKWVGIINEQNPDIVIVAGDIIDADMTMRDEEAQVLRSIAAPCGTYAVLGNHEVYSGLNNSRSFIARSGMILLENAAHTGGPIEIAGVNDPQVERFAGGAKPDAAALLQKLNQGKFVLLLKHQPVFETEEIGLFDLQISGHTHGGQIWPGSYMVRRIFGLEQGLNHLGEGKNKSLLYLMNGTAYWGPPMRLMARPEILVVDILFDGKQ